MPIGHTIAAPPWFLKFNFLELMSIYNALYHVEFDGAA